MASACSQDKATPQTDTSTKTLTSSSATTSAEPGSEDSAAAKELARAAIRDWVNAQVAGDFERYTSFYDTTFQGVRRTAKGDMKKFGLDGWKVDRAKMVNGKPKVAADNVEVQTWKDKPGLAKNTVEVRFIQRFRSARYADHGPKVIRMRITGSKARFIYEEMLSSTKGWSSGAASAAPKIAYSGWKFVRAEISPHDAKGVDACIYQGGFGFACLDAFLAERDAGNKLFMRWISNAEAAVTQHALDKGELKGAGTAHAEFAMNCQDSGPCGKDKDDGYACLTKAEQALWDGDKAKSDAALKRACECGLKRAVFPVMGGTLACNAPNDYGTRGRILPLEAAKTFLTCAKCSASTGPAACAKTIEYMTGRGYKDVADYILNRHVPRCQQP